jgi:hypothetical protein
VADSERNYSESLYFLASSPRGRPVSKVDVQSYSRATLLRRSLGAFAEHGHTVTHGSSLGALGLATH